MGILHIPADRHARQTALACPEQSDFRAKTVLVGIGALFELRIQAGHPHASAGNITIRPVLI